MTSFKIVSMDQWGKRVFWDLRVTCASWASLSFASSSFLTRRISSSSLSRFFLMSFSLSKSSSSSLESSTIFSLYLDTEASLPSWSFVIDFSFCSYSPDSPDVFLGSSRYVFLASLTCFRRASDSKTPSMFLARKRQVWVYQQDVGVLRPWETNHESLQGFGNTD